MLKKYVYIKERIEYLQTQLPVSKINALRIKEGIEISFLIFNLEN